MITALGGGVGASKLLKGLKAVMPDEKLTVVVNTADDITIHGLRVSPDIDTVIYWLSDSVDREKGWGQKGDSFRFLDALKRFGADTWFKLGDLDLATHIFRTDLRQRGLSPTEITAKIAEAFGLSGVDVLPMTDSDVETWVETDSGIMHFQEYFVKERMSPGVSGVKFKGAEHAKPSPGVLEAINNCRGIVICPSNPIISIGPILAIAGIGQALGDAGVPVVAVSPIIGGKALKGPADRMMSGLGLDVSSLGVAKLYRDFLHTIIIDSQDAELAGPIRALGIEAVVMDTIMTDDEKAAEIARKMLEIF